MFGLYKSVNNIRNKELSTCEISKIKVARSTDRKYKSKGKDNIQIGSLVYCIVHKLISACNNHISKLFNVFEEPYIVK